MNIYVSHIGYYNERWFSWLEKNTLMRIRKDIEGHIGSNVSVSANKGRKKIVVREGVLKAAYPNLFVVEIDNDFAGTRKVSYTYTDVLTKTVEVTIKADSKAKIS